MNILYITNYESMYGANKSLLDLLIRIKEKGVNPYVLISGVPGGGDMGDACRKSDIPVISTQFRLSYLEGNTRFYRFRRTTRRIMRFIDYLRVYKEIRSLGISFDLIHSNSSVFDIGYYLSRWFEIPHVWHIREFAGTDYDLHFVASERLKAKQYDNSFVITISDAIARLVVDKDRNNIVRIYDGIDIPKPYEKSYMVDGVLNICILGACRKSKNQLDAIKTCQKLTERGFNNFMLHIVGVYEEEYYKEIQRFLNNYPKLREKIVFYGHRNNVSEILRGMDVGIMASDSEALGRVTVEYMANYMTVFGTNSGGTPELISQSNLFEVHDTNKLSHMIEEIMINTDILKENGPTARKKAEEFEPAICADKVYAIYEHAIR